MRRIIPIVTVCAIALAAAAYSVSNSISLSTGDALDLDAAVLAVRNRFQDVAHIDTEMVKALLESKTSGAVQIVDVRDPAEFAVSHIPGAINVPTGTSDAELLVAVRPDRPVIVYCSIGYRSSIIARRLRAAGRENVSNYAGSIFAWANAGQPLESSRGRVKIVHPYDEHWGRYLKPEYRAF